MTSEETITAFSLSHRDSLKAHTPRGNVGAGYTSLPAPKKCNGYIMNITAHFTDEEFICRHCGKSGVKLELVEALEALRGHLGRPIIINSGYRCPAHPVEAAKLEPGYHTKGIAADLRVPGMTPREVYAVALTMPQFKGFGVDDENGYIHLDTRPKMARWCYHQGQVVPWKDLKKG